MIKKYLRAILVGFLGSFGILAVFVTVSGLISGFSFAIEQFTRYWYYFILLAAGFGVQAGLYSFLRQKVRQKASTGVLAATGTTSTLAMISCCAHYLVNILPFIGASGLVAFVASYQIQFFWIGILFNMFGIIFISWRLNKFLKGA